MTQRFTVDGMLPSLNQIIGASKAHWSRYRRDRDAAALKVALAIRRAKLRPITARVRVTLTYYCPDRRTDPDNISAGVRKVALDQLQAEGILANDGHREIGGFVETFFVDAARPRIEIELEEVEHDGA